jgi:hypothetical protein
MFGYDRVHGHPRRSSPGCNDTLIEAVNFRRTLFLTRVPKRTERFLIRRLASLIYSVFQKRSSRILLSVHGQDALGY